MKTIKQTVLLFLDHERSNIPAHMIGEAKLNDNIICIKLGSFGVTPAWRDYFLIYTDEEKATDDYRKLLRYQKKMSGLLCKSR